MDYEKEYNETLERAREIYSDPKKALEKNVNLTNEGTIAAIRVALLDLFSEEQLKCSEDEIIRKELLKVIKHCYEDGGYALCTDDYKKYSSYLEKQKEQKPVKLDDDTEIGLDRALQIVKAANGNLRGYQSDDGIYECCHAIQTLERILKNGIEQKPEIKYVYPKFRKGDVIEPIMPNGHYVPVRVIGIYDGSYSCRSDDDKAYLSFSIKCEDEYRLVEQKPAEWSEEDKRIISEVVQLIEDGALDRGEKDFYINRLKSLRPQPRWKPSEEQMKALEEVRTIFHHHHLWDEINPILYDYEELMRDLQKL